MNLVPELPSQAGFIHPVVRPESCNGIVDYQVVRIIPSFSLNPGFTAEWSLPATTYLLPLRSGVNAT